MTVLDNRVPEAPLSSDSATFSEVVERAEEGFRRACTALARHGGDVHALRAAVRSAARLTKTLAITVDNIAGHAPRSVKQPEMAADLVADLKALRNCLATGAAVIDPALDDLHHLSGRHGADAEFARRYHEWAAATEPVRRP
ncbi:hypothetical protein [Saccharomonospora sp.]|uniref:hypothetical protein n=1 Tax=Saccharomonospora sp. TaxID=33913 RepID=UPI00262DD7D9|nr:hypothetical protein [Saccharomonospora sp.]